MSDARPLAHRLDGAGAPVVLLNGGMMTASSWEPIAARLAEHYRVLRFDFRGQILSLEPGPRTLAGHADDLIALLDRLEWPAAHLVGTSFGAEVALELAAAHPERTLSLVAITAVDRADAEFTAGCARMAAILRAIDQPGARERYWDELVATVYSPAFVAREAEALAARRAQLALLPRPWFDGVLELVELVATMDLVERLPRVACPALVVAAGDDRVMAAERSLALARALGAEVAVHPTAGHGLVAEEPEWLAEVVLEFLARHVRPAA